MAVMVVLFCIWSICFIIIITVQWFDIVNLYAYQNLICMHSFFIFFYRERISI